MHPVVRVLLQNGPIIAYYYNMGDENNAVTGGWGDGYDSGTGSKSKQADHLLLSTSGGNKVYETNSKVDLTNVSTIKIQMEGSSSSTQENSAMQLVVGSNDGGFDVAAVFRLGGAVANATYELDVSALSGSYYLRCWSTSNTGYTNTAKFYQVWGE
jgi:hypothetical protein